MDKKAFFGVAVLLLALAGLIYFFANQKAQPAAVETKTYRSNIYSFEIKIPQDWQVDDQTYPNEICFASPGKVQAMKNPTYDGLCGEIVFGNTSYLMNASPESIKTVQLGDLEFTNYVGGEAYENDSYIVRNFFLTYNFETDGSEKARQVLASFRSLETEGNYKNDKYGFSFVKPNIPVSNHDYSKKEGAEILNDSSLYLGDSANLSLGVYAKSQMNTLGQDVIQSNPSYNKITINNHDAWQHQGYGPAHAWFITTVVYGKKYGYVFMFSDESKNQKYIDMQNAIVSSFSWSQ